MGKKKIFISLFLYIATFFLSANAQGVEYFFITLPNKYLMQLSNSQRQLMITNMREGKKDSSVVNNYGGKSSLVAFNEQNEYIQVKLSSQGNFAAKKFMMPDSSALFAMSFWLCSPACDGEIAFFKGKSLTEVSGKELLPQIKISDFFDKDSLSANEVTSNELENTFDANFIHYELLNDNSNTILVCFDNETYLSKDTFKRWKKMMKGDRLPFTWMNGRFVKGEAYFSK
ncbi:MAG TPA: DUF3256 family protein [Paludibacteraceae bacterium]|jgi:hypothetical protein|nr:DUF3256 family protein [Paludibacteraceae bacterium]HPH63785.1 DUF3256 family protein [Paludibacteraceae bacterium]